MDGCARGCVAGGDPKQYEGRYDAGVLCFCRGNRSERIFDEAVAALASGSQPNASVLASVGYLLRSTAFAGNGLFGIRPFEGLGAGHALGRRTMSSSCAPTCCAVVLDLVDAMACARGGVALDRRLNGISASATPPGSGGCRSWRTIPGSWTAGSARTRRRWRRRGCGRPMVA